MASSSTTASVTAKPPPAGGDGSASRQPPAAAAPAAPATAAPAATAAAAPAAAPAKKVVTALRRGGYVIATESCGNIQVIMPPETVKDSMIQGIATPEHYVFPDKHFDKIHGINLGEFEFPAYFNFFVRRRQINLVCTPRGEEAIRTIFQETLFGPVDIDNASEFSTSISEDARANLRKELDYFRRNPFKPTENMRIEDLLRFTHFDESGKATINDVEIRMAGAEYHIYERGARIAEVPIWQRVDVEQAVAAGHESRSELDHPVVFDPPSLGVTMLGTSHGFDPCGNTTGAVVWINGRGVVVDPPPHCSVHLRRNHTPAALIDAVILTHCHADHDSGTFQRIIEENRVVVMTTPTIMHSFVRKYAAVSGLPRDFLWTLFEFRPVTIGEPVRFRGGEFHFHYSLHSIPCIGFSLKYGGKSLIFSGDTCNDPGRLETMYRDGVLSRGRFEQLVNFPWHHDLILHEAGVPPIHTPLTTFHPLSDDVKSRLLLVHTAKKDVPPECGLRTAMAGVEHTVRLEVVAPPHRDAISLTDLLASIDIFRQLPLSFASALMQTAVRRVFEVGEFLVRQGDPGETFFVIATGEVHVELGGVVLDKVFTTGDYFGEISVFSKDKRTASIVASTRVSIYEFDGEMLFHLLRDAGVLDKLRNVSLMRQQHSWALISRNSILSRATASQKTQLQAVLQFQALAPDAVLWAPGDVARGCYLIESGALLLTYAAGSRSFGPGGFVCDMAALEAAQRSESAPAVRHSSRLAPEGEAVVYFISRQDILAYMERNPGMRVCLFDELWLE